MNSFRRWTIGVCAKFDDLLGQVENHEAIAAQALSDMRTSLARARAQLGRVERDCRVLLDEVETAHKTSTRWKERAKKESEDARALECLKRSRLASEDAHKLEQRLQEQKRMAEQVRKTIIGLEQKFVELRGKQRLLSTRQAAAQASEALHAESGAAGEVEDVFSRWEIRLSEQEFVPGAPGMYGEPLEDSFGEGYGKEEERASLEAELSLLRAADHEESKEGEQSI